MPSIKQLFFNIDDTGRDRFWHGRALINNQIAAGIYLAVAFGPLVYLFWCSGTTRLDLWKMGSAYRLGLLALGVIVTSGPPAWFWIEARAFDDWVNRKRYRAESIKAASAKAAQNEAPKNVETSEYAETPEQEEKRLRETFKLNADSEKAFWAAIVAVYAAVLLKF